MWKALIVDDEVMARESLAILLSKFEDIEVSGTAESAIEARSILKEQAVDVVFLDVEMPQLSGLEFLATSEKLPKVILTTNNPVHAAEAYEYEVLDFITKPVNLRRLTKAIERLRSSTPRLSGLDSIFVRSEGKYVRIETASLLYVETLDDYVVLNMEDGLKHIVHSTLSNMEKILPQDTFFKCHRSFLINLSQILDVADSTVVIQRQVIPISRAHRKPLRDKLGL